MDAMSSRISENLRQIRKEKKLSLDSMAEQTGVSKSMLGQIERGERTHAKEDRADEHLPDIRP